MSQFLFSFLCHLPFVPAAFLCLFPMQNQLRTGLGKTILKTLLFLTVLISAAGLLELYPPFSYYRLLPFLFIICLIFFQRSVYAHFCKTFCLLVLVCAIMSFIANFANAYDAMRHPTSDIDHFSTEAAVLQAFLSVICVLLLLYPFRVFGGRLIDQFHLRRVWYTSSLVSLFFLIINLLMVPRHYETMHVNNVALFYWTALPLMFCLLLLLCVIFYFIVSGLLEAALNEKRVNILEMQETQFAKQQKYLESITRERHDFKHTIRALKSLADTNDLEGIRHYLEQYLNAMPQNEVKSFCKNAAVNAVLNYYHQWAEDEHISCRFRIELPDDLLIPELELCSIIGNILENAVFACNEMKEEKKAERFIDLTITTRHRFSLYIVATNSFNGKVKEKNGHYYSTQSKGTGVGLSSVLSIAELLGGMASFSHEGTEFYSDVMLPLKPDLEKRGDQPLI
ncbi:MAG: ATP-binding protein [Lachnospiraceae bacterium]|nr:ATP-binding protein [Lachnospiraceae bacterium]